MISTQDRVELAILGGFESTYCGSTASLPLGAQRLLAFLALRDGGSHRAAAAEHLWPDSSPRRAAANLRSALWRIRQFAGVTAIECDGSRLRLSCEVDVDLHRVLRQARSIRSLACGPPTDNWPTLVDALSRELLPTWAEDWLVMERQRWDQERLYALEGLGQTLRSAELYLGALQTALAAVAIEPLRETSHRIVIEVHISEGNAACAIKHYQRYRALLQRELGVAPSSRMAQLVSSLMPSL